MQARRHLLIAARTRKKRMATKQWQMFAVVLKQRADALTVSMPVERRAPIVRALCPTIPAGEKVAMMLRTTAWLLLLLLLLRLLLLLLLLLLLTALFLGTKIRGPLQRRL